ncbi:hypothetical protein HID58_066204 [Brassica napus]|uniref:Replication protein A 70 kDa DNA-binding subunit B/D first OB fold domain-containing protein n=1 Tax=Brassica napus TaxID=3708 RepID=A0ABQ7ZEZ5_BRANA|nr:hypothetical protein HID58_066204 [Brassica napus]
MSKMKLAFTPVAQLKPDSENEIWKIKGDRIQACIRGKLISKFEDDLGEGKCCILMNFKLSPNLGNYRGTLHPFKIFFTWSTHVKKNCEKIPNDSLRFNCISFDDLLSQKHDEKVFVDVIGEIVGPCDLKEITVRNAPCKILNFQLKDCGMSKDVMSTTSSGSLLTLSNCTQVSSDHIPFDNRKTISQLLASYEETRCCRYATICALKIEAPWWEVIQLIHKSAYELLEQQVQFNGRNEFPREFNSSKTHVNHIDA